jgi:ATP-dependent DNA helicase DinG
MSTAAATAGSVEWAWGADDPYADQAAVARDAKTADIESRFPATLVARAKKRTVHAAGHHTWIVEGMPKLGDALDAYEVRLKDGARKYHCTCYTNNYGQARARRACSHVLAVVLWRKGSTGESALSPVEGEGVQAAPGMFVPTLSPTLEQLPEPLPTLDDPMWKTDITPWPEWITEFRPHQWDAVQEALEHRERGARIVWMDAPTGSGKSLIGEMYRRLTTLAGGEKALYVCHGIDLQEQYLRDFPYARLLKGKTNYATLSKPFPDWTADDCTRSPGGEDCSWCSEVERCPYTVAKSQALRARLMLLNTAYFLNEANYVGQTAGRGLVIADECDTLESQLMGFVSFELSARQLHALGLDAPKKGSHKKTIVEWLTGPLLEAIDKKLRMAGGDQLFMQVVEPNVRQAREIARLKKLRDAAREVAGKIASENWIRDNEDGGSVVMKPITVGEYGPGMLWAHGGSWLCMSATIISPQEMARSLGVDLIEDMEHATVRVPMTFPLANRKIHAIGVADVTHANKADAWPKLAAAIRKLMARHPNERGLVHTVNYKLAEYLANELRGTGRVVTYERAFEREAAMRRFVAKDNAVMFAPSMDRGVDFKEDLARWMVVCKMPYPNLGDVQTARRAHGPGGDQWFAVQTVRKLVQMTGRGVRSETDTCVTYILDKQFGSNVWQRNSGLLPKWWRDALDYTFPVRELVG